MARKSRSVSDDERMIGKLNALMKHKPSDRAEPLREAEPEPEPDGECVVCHGPLVVNETREFDPRLGPLIIGPGSRNQYSTVHHGWYCEWCGIRYHHLPSRPACRQVRPSRRRTSQENAPTKWSGLFLLPHDGDAVPGTVLDDEIAH